MLKLIAGIGVLVLVAMALIALSVDPVTAPNWDSEKQAPATGIDATPGAIYSIKFPDLDGKQRELGEWQHKLLVINFWATWCGPCKEEMPMLARLQAEFGSRNVQIIGIAADSHLNVANFAQKNSIGYPLLPDELRAIEFSRRLGNRLGLLPYTVALRPGGQVIFSRLGVVAEADLRRLFSKN